ncbi:hypothetical protein [Methylocystis sp.]|uniref:hypothetical protein n=1 Tax=Methylocystis sp. TaxID=1911079 RepID=UPI003DA224E8
MRREGETPRPAEGRFIGVHITWIDLEAPKGKAETVDPDTGMMLPATKIRGSLKGGSIRLVYGGETPTRYFIGEGIETVLYGVAVTAPH